MQYGPAMIEDNAAMATSREVYQAMLSLLPGEVRP